MPAKNDKIAEDTIRTFIAIKLPDHVQTRLREVQEQLKEYKIKITWSRPENIHLTLKFLGDIKPEMATSVGRVMEEAAKDFRPMTLCSQAVGFFPNVKRPRVIWTGISGQTDALGQLCEKLDLGLSGLGFQKEARNFTGHLTLGRVKGGGTPDLFIEIMKKFQDMSTEAFTVDSVNLYKSKLMPSGPIYTKLLSVPLKAEN